MATIRSVELVNYKGFRDTRVAVSGTSVLVGANNAGKSTVVGALRLVAAGLPSLGRGATTSCCRGRAASLVGG